MGVVFLPSTVLNGCFPKVLRPFFPLVKTGLRGFLFLTMGLDLCFLGGGQGVLLSAGGILSVFFLVWIELRS